MIRPDYIGRKCLYFNPAFSTKFSSANITAIDSVAGVGDVISPYAYTATVREDYDAINYIMADAGASLAAGQRVAFGLFLTPDNDKKNLMFQVMGKVALDSSASGFYGSFFFGRKATDNTVASSLVAASNTLALYSLLPSESVQIASDSVVGTNGILLDSIESEVFSLELVGGFVYCFGYVINNFSGTGQSMHGNISLSFRKYQSEIGVFRPSR